MAYFRIGGLIMITVKGRTLQISSTERNIGIDGDNKVNTVSFAISDMAMSDFDFKLDVKSGGEVGIVDLVKNVESDKILLMWEVLKEHISNGLIRIQIRAFSSNDEVWHSEIGYLYVGNSINATDYFPSPLPSEFEQMEQRATAIQSDVTAKSAEVEADRAEVASNKQTVFEKTAEAIQSATNALASEQKAKTSEDNAKASENEAAQQAIVASNNILNGVDAHNADYNSHPSILSDLVTVEAIARGKANAKAFDTVEDMNTWLAVPENVEGLNIGDNLYIRDLLVPDYWWDGTQAQVLEAESVNLSDYYTKSEVDARLPIVIEQSDYDALVDAGTIIAGRIYYVVADGEPT